MAHKKAVFDVPRVIVEVKTSSDNQNDAENVRKKIANFHIEAKPGEKGKERLRRERREIVPQRTRFRRRGEEEEDAPRFYISFWVYSDAGKLDVDASRLDVPVTLNELFRHSIKTILTKEVFVTPGAINYYRMYACFKRSPIPGQPEVLGPEIKSIRDFGMLPPIPIEDLHRIPASMWVGIPPEVVLTPEQQLKVSPFSDLCGYILRSSKPLPFFPVFLLVNKDPGEWYRNFNPYGDGKTAPGVVDEMRKVFSGKETLIINYPAPDVEALVKRRGERSPSFLAGVDSTKLYPKIEFAPKDSLNDIYNMLFHPDRISGSKGLNWFSRGFEKDVVQLIKQIKKYRTYYRGVNVKMEYLWSRAVSRAALGTMVYHMRAAEKNGDDKFRSNWFFYAYAPYVVRAGYSIKSTDLPGGNQYRKVAKILRAYIIGDEFIELEMTRDQIPDADIAIAKKRASVLMDPEKAKEFADVPMRRGETYTLWRPVRITQESMEEYVAERRSEGTQRGHSLPVNDTSPSISEILSDFKTPASMQTRRSPFGAVRPGLTKDFDRYLLWSNTDAANFPLKLESGDLSDPHRVGFALLRQTNPPIKLSEAYGDIKFSPTPLPEGVGFVFGTQEDVMERMATTRATFLPHIMLHLDFKNEDIIYHNKENVLGSVLTDEWKTLNDMYPEYTEFDKEISFSEYVRLQNEYEKVTKTSMPINLMLSEEEIRNIPKYSNRHAIENFMGAVNQGTAQNLKTLTEPLPPLL